MEMLRFYLYYFELQFLKKSFSFSENLFQS